MKIPKLFFLILSAAFIISIAPPLSQADNDPSPVNINFQVEGPTSSIYNQNLTVPACVTPNNASSTVNGFCAFNASGLTADVTWLSFGGLVNSINGISGDSSNFWLWFLNGEPASIGMDSYMLQPNDKILWALGRQPLKVSLSTASPKVNATSTVTVLGFNPNSFAFEPVGGASIIGTDLITSANGTADIVATSTNPLIISVNASGYIPSEQFSLTPKPQSVNVVIRNNLATAFSGSVDLPGGDESDILVTPTSGTTSPVAISPRSVLGVLENLQTTSSTFKITDLAYFSSFNSFLVNCVAIPASLTTPDCYNWTYAINNSFPQMGIDQAMVKDGDTIYFFFGSPHKTTLSKTTVSVGETFTATAQMYDLSTGTYVPLTGVTLGIGNFNPDFSFSEIATSTVNSLGQASFSLNATGTMEVGIKEDFYFPTTQITIAEAAPAPPSGGGGGGSAPLTFNIPSALSYISLQQTSDGSFDSSLTTDWTAIAFASADPGNAKLKLKTYLQNYNYQPSSITDYERHAMALQALGINPYSGTQTDYITPIVNAFDGNQIGDTSLETDDIFAIFPLTHAGYTGNDEIIKKEIAYIISKQKPNGSWNDSVDVTAAAVMAIGPFFQTPGYVQATGKAFGYLASTQNQNGGWGNVDSTSWVVTMLNSVREGDPSHFKNIVNSSGLSGMDYLAKNQNADGSVTSANKTWSTSYAVTAASGKSWLSVLNNFSKPTTNNQPSGNTNAGGTVLGTSTLVTLPLTTSTSTPATTTPSTISTTTPTIIEVITPTTTPEVLPLPKPKVNKVKTAIKPKVVVISPTPTPPATESMPVAKDETQSPLHKPNWFIRALTSISSFFYKLF